MAQERERLREWESELSAQREASSEKARALEARAAKRERMLEDREQELHEREQDIKVTETLREGTVASTVSGVEQRPSEASLAQLRENLEESYAQRAAELEERAKAAEVRAAERAGRRRALRV